MDNTDLKKEALAIGENLTSMREAFGLSQREFAILAGVNRTSINKLEKQQLEIGPNGISKIQTVFDCKNLQEFIAKADRLKNLDKKSKQQLQDMSPAERKGYYLNLAQELNLPTIRDYIEQKPEEYEASELGVATLNLRIKRGMSRQELADKLSIPIKTLQSFELGQSLLMPDRLERLPRALGCNNLDDVIEQGREKYVPVKEDYSFLAPSLKSLREAFGISKLALARETDVADSSIRELENGRQVMSESAVKRLLEFFDCSDAGELVNKAEKLKSIPLSDSQTVANMLTDERRSYYLKMADAICCPKIRAFIENSGQEYDANILGMASRKRREEIGLSRKQVAEEVGVVASAITNFELGNTMLNPQSLEKLPNALLCQDIGEILNGGVNHWKHLVRPELIVSEAKRRRSANDGVLGVGKDYRTR